MRRSKTHKYKAIRTTVDEITFASKGEARRYKELKFLESIGSIQALVLQPKYPIDLYGNHICDYVADFEYLEDGKVIAEDFKGVRTAVYMLKKKLFNLLYSDTHIHRETTAKPKRRR
jgi:hypothetical protein